MFRLFRALVAEGLGLGGLVWMMTLFSGDDPSSSRSAPTPIAAFDSVPSEVITLRKPAVYASLDPPVESQESTFFRGTDSLLDR
ncbi:MAG TPA: hypothetical protein VGN57_14165 [Pirellulaceae bacterium]|jgi:hypothetical protein|nr:hypothetical protein [Pirellulaceae bacterium]